MLFIYLSSFLAGAYLILLNNPFTLYTSGKILGVWSLTALTFQLVLITRVNWLDRVLGYDRVTRWHAANGFLILILVLMHPIMIFSRQILSMDFAAILSFVLANPFTFLGEAAVALIVFQIFATLYWRGLDYEHWKIIHRIGYLIVVLGFLHSFIGGTDISFSPLNPVAVWWVFLAGVSISSFAYRYLYRPLEKRESFTVVNVEEEVAGVHTVELEPREEDMEHEPGQFAFVTFKSDNIPGEEHHFTISSAPGTEGFTYTIKDVGDFTGYIGELETGDEAVVEGPYGKFTPPREGTLTLIAGGIGITPFMSMIREIDRNDGRETHLVYGNRTRNEIVFREELEELERKNDWLKVTHVLSDEDVEGYRHGFIDRELLEETDTGSEYLVCGPPPMMDAVVAELEELGVPKSRIRTERFALRPSSVKDIFR